MAKETYDHRQIEVDTQALWEAAELYTSDLSANELDDKNDPYYLLVEFPYPSGDLHTGHWYAYAMPDIYARYLRMVGKNVLFPFGFDSFGLPAENAAIKRGLDPKKWTYENIDSMRKQVKSMGTSFDWSKQVITSDPEYYRWTQWLFSKLYEHQLAERREAAVKWCPFDKTVLANEQVINGHCERCGNEVEEKVLTQWFLKITQYAKRLLADLDPLPWREEIKDAQRAWIGESEGAKLRFALQDVNFDSLEMDIEVFTTRPDTIFGATYVVLAPEHPMVELLAHAIINADEIAEYKTATGRKTERERSENKENTGVRLAGIHAINPATHEPLPVFIADYVLASYGTGAVMAVPAHDERDFEFAQKFELPIKHVIDPITGDDQQDPKHKGKIVAVVEHDDKILTIKWPKELGGRLLVGGTAEEGEDPAVTAAREITEETGYIDLEFVEQADEQVHHSYFAFSKNQATIAHTTLLHFRLHSDAQQEQKLEDNEVGKFTVEWVSKEQAEKEIHDPLHLYALARFTNYKPYTGNGILRNSGDFSGRENTEVLKEITESIGGELVTNYRLRDWLVSRQRYWGCPIPVVYDPEGEPHLVPAEHLPWLLPTDVDFTLTGKSPLATSKELQERVEKIFGEGWTPEYDTLDTFVDSSWYFLRYLDPTDANDFSDSKLMKRWTPVDRYSGGSEHTTMHLLYARFFHKALHDLSLVPTSEPFLERFNRGLIMGPDGQKMSKSKGNVINPDELVQKYGADAVRLYLAFIGPYNEPGQYPWNLDGVESMRRFLDRIYKLSSKVAPSESEVLPPELTLTKTLAKASNKIATDIARFKFNTAISHLMVLVRELEALESVPQVAYLDLITLLAPFAPHLAEHLWLSCTTNMDSAQGGESATPSSVHIAPWPYQGVVFKDEFARVIVQVNSKKKGEISLPLDATEEMAIDAARENEVIAAVLDGSTVSRTIYVSGRILNFVTA